MTDLSPTPEAAPDSDGPELPVAVVTSRQRWLIPVIAVAAVVVILAGFSIYWFAIRTPTMTVSGSLALGGSSSSGNYTLTDPDPSDHSACQGASGYDDIEQGADVVVTNASGKTVGVGELGAGLYIVGTDGCFFPFTVSGVPSDLSFYGVTISHRGDVQFTKAQMKKGPLLSLGDD